MSTDGLDLKFYLWSSPSVVSFLGIFSPNWNITSRWSLKNWVFQDLKGTHWKIGLIDKLQVGITQQNSLLYRSFKMGPMANFTQCLGIFLKYWEILDHLIIFFIFVYFAVFEWLHIHFTSSINKSCKDFILVCSAVFEGSQIRFTSWINNSNRSYTGLFHSFWRVTPRFILRDL